MPPFALPAGALSCIHLVGDPALPPQGMRTIVGRWNRLLSSPMMNRPYAVLPLRHPTGAAAQLECDRVLHSTRHTRFGAVDDRDAPIICAPPLADFEHALSGAQGNKDDNTNVHCEAQQVLAPARSPEHSSQAAKVRSVPGLVSFNSLFDGSMILRSR